MTKEEFNLLDEKDRALASIAYIDGFKAALDIAKSVVVRVGDKDIDNTFLANRSMVIDVMKQTLKRLETSIS